MDIKTLLGNLHEELSCSLCKCSFTEPKQLPCLHNFRLPCLNGVQRARLSTELNRITCPECRQEFRVPENGNLGAFPTNFRISSLLDVLARKEYHATGARCGNCDKKSVHSSYCFQCREIWCDYCIIFHDGIKSNKEHHALALKDFENHDFEIKKRSAFCGNPGHVHKEFCKSCEVVICYSCIAALNKLCTAQAPRSDESENDHNLHLKAVIKSQNQRVLQKRERIKEIQARCANIQTQVDRVKSGAQIFVDSMIAILEAKKQELFNDVEKKAKESLHLLRTQQSELESQEEVIKTAIQKTKQLLKKTNDEIAKFGTNGIFQGLDYIDGEEVNCDLEKIYHIVFIQNEMLMDKVKSEGIGSFRSFLSNTVAQRSSAEGEGIKEAIVGLEAQIVVTTRTAEGVQSYEEHDFVKVEIRNRQGHTCATKTQVEDNGDGAYKITYFARETGTCAVSVKVNGDDVHGSPFEVQVRARQFKHVSSFGLPGPSLGRCNYPWGFAVNGRSELVVTHRLNHRVQIFRSDGSCLRAFGSKGDQEGQFNKPTGVAFHNDKILVADCNNHRVQVFSAQGEFLCQFGGEGDLNDQLNLPLGLSVNCEGNLIIADARNKSVKVFSTSGRFLRKIGTAHSFTFPFHCIQHDNHLVVSDFGENCVKVFDRAGKFMYKFGKPGKKDGEFNGPSCLSVSKAGQLIVCDSQNYRVQIFEMSGKFVSKFGCYDSGKGMFNELVSTAVLRDGKIAVSDFFNHRVQIFE